MSKNLRNLKNLKKIKVVNNLIKENGKFKTWEQVTREFKFYKNLCFKLIQLVLTIPKHWKHTLTENTTNSQNLSYLNHHLIKSNQTHSVKKLTAKELYLISLQDETATPTSQKKFPVEIYLYSYSTYYHNRF